MASALLVAPDIDGGKRLLEILDESGEFPVSGAFWRYLEEPDIWRLFIVTPLVEDLGIRAALRKVREIAGRADPSGGKLDFFVLKPSDKRVQLLDAGFHTGPGFHEISFKMTGIQGQYIPPTYIYRMNL